MSDPQQHRRISVAAVVSGVVALACGVALAIRSNLAGASPGSHLGIPLMLVGVFGLLLGVFVQMVWLRRDSRAALDRMRLIDLRLQEYRSTSLLLGGRDEDQRALGKCLARIG